MKEAVSRLRTAMQGRFLRLAPWLCLLHASVVWGWIELEVRRADFPSSFWFWWLLSVAWFAWAYVLFRQRRDACFLMAFLPGLVGVLSDLFFAMVIPLWRLGRLAP